MPAIFDETVVAPGFEGDLTGNVTGAVIGSLAGNSAGSHTGPVAGTVNGGVIPPGTVLSGDGEIAIPSASAMFAITKGSIAALTIDAPAVGDNYKELTIWSETAFAHVITCSDEGFNGKGSTGTLTFGGAAGDSVKLVARNGSWWTSAVNNVVAA